MSKPAEWYVRRAEKVHGPFTADQVKQLAEAQKITPETELRRGADGQWVLAKKVKGLFVSAPTKELIPAPPLHAESTSLATVVTREEQLPAVHEVTRVPCPFCGEDIVSTAIKCRHCNEFLDGRPRELSYSPPPYAPPPFQPQPQVNVVVTQQVGMHVARWNPGVAMVLSFIFPGLGQLYKGQLLNGLVWFFVVVFGYFAFIVPGIVLHILCIAGAGMGDPYR